VVRCAPIAAALLAAALTLVAGCGTSAANKTSTSPTMGPTRARTAAASATPGQVTASLPVVSCPTASGAGQQPTVTLPRSRSVAVSQALAASLSVYADKFGIMRLLGPKGWRCTAKYGADGSGGITVYPPGEGPSAMAKIVGYETSACVGCTLQQACPLFTNAALAQRSSFPCPSRRPATETVVPVAKGIVAFDDPPGVKGDGQQSGGRYTAHSVMTYHPSVDNGSWEETCILPGSEKDVCTAALNSFISWFGQR
jgi:Domain of unknown function (DUF4850)